MIDLIGVPLDLGSERLGADSAPNALRKHNFIEHLQQAGLIISDLEDIRCPSPEESIQGDSSAKYLEPIARICESLANKVSENAKNQHQIIVLGGDHSIAIGSVSGAAQGLQGDIGLIWIDAHGDLNTPQTTPSGNIHGMPFAVLLGYGHERLTTIAGSTPPIKPENTLAIGFKDLDSAERTFIKEHRLPVVFINDILAHGLEPVFSGIDRLIKTTDHIWVSFDLDAIDSLEAPGVGMPNKGGLTYREIYAICKYIGKHCTIAGLDLVEYNPDNDAENKTARLATELTAALFGTEYSQYTDYLQQHGIKK